LQDWFVPVLYQEKEDVQLLKEIPTDSGKEMFLKELKTRLGLLPKEPAHGFVGRSRELLRLERLLAQKKYVVLCGSGGEGKTTTAVELARWLVRSKRFDRAVFVYVEELFDVRAVMDLIGRQLLPGFSVASYKSENLFTEVVHVLQRRLRQQRTIILFDNMESFLPSEGVSWLAKEELALFFQLCTQLLEPESTALIFTSREPLPEPFNHPGNVTDLSRLFRNDAVELVHRAMTVAGLTPKAEDVKEAQPEVEALVESVNCHARSLVLLAPYVGELGVRHTTENLGRLMAELDKQHPGSRELSLFASLELSLRRLPEKMQAKLKHLGLFHGGASLKVLQKVLELTDQECAHLTAQLQHTGLVQEMPYNFLNFHPALTPYLRSQRDADPEAAATAHSRWVESMKEMLVFIYEQHFEDAQLSSVLAVLEMPNLLALLDHAAGQGDAAETVGLAVRLEQLLALLGRKDLLARVTAVREAAARTLAHTAWSHARFLAAQYQIEWLQESGLLNSALPEAQALLEHCEQAGDEAYPGADYDTAVAALLLGRILNFGGSAEAALAPTESARRRFQTLADRGNTSAAQMASVCLTQTGDSLLYLGRLEKAAEAYEAGIAASEKLEDKRTVAVGKGQLGTVRLFQKRYADPWLPMKRPWPHLTHWGNREGLQHLGTR